MRDKIIATALITTLAGAVVELIWLDAINKLVSVHIFIQHIPDNLYFCSGVAWFAILLVHDIWKPR